MTICIGSLSSNSIFIGTDSLWTLNDSFVRSYNISKFIEVPAKYKDKILIATAGQDKYTQIFKKVLKKEPNLLDFKNEDEVYELVDALRLEAKEFGVGEPENNELPSHELEFLIGSAITNSLWAIDSDYAVNEFKEYMCIGAGAFLGESAMLALSKQNVEGEAAVKTALETVMALHPFCGGKIEIRQLKLN